MFDEFELFLVSHFWFHRDPGTCVQFQRKFHSLVIFLRLLERYLRVLDAIANGTDPDIPPKYLIFSPMGSQGFADNEKVLVVYIYESLKGGRLFFVGKLKLN